MNFRGCGVGRLGQKASLIIWIAIPFLACFKQEVNTTWRVYKADFASTSYSGLDEINKGNVDQLEVAWIFDPKDATEGIRLPKYECNPIIIDRIMYATSASHLIYAVDAQTGQKIWSYDPFDKKTRVGIKRGVTFWEQGEDRRILFTAGEYLFALDADTGLPIDDFGKEGKVRLDIDLGMNPDSIWVIPTSPGIVFNNLLVLGSEVSELHDAAPGHVRAYDIPSGELRWTFHTIPQPGEKGYETWPQDAWKNVGGANNWGGMSLDQDRGTVYIPLGSPSYDYYGKNRHGKNLFGNCIVALEAATGKLVWYFQTVHHDLWDYDLPAPPNLVSVKREGKLIDGVAQTTKTGFLFVLNRETGEPLFPIEERPVPSSTVPGEKAWPTQPYPLKPEPYARQQITAADITAFTPEDHEFLKRRFEEVRYEGLYTPPDKQGTLMLPGSRGGSEWGGAAYDPTTGILYLNANESPEIAMMESRTRESRSEKQTTYERGKRFYIRYCASCHGQDRAGIEPDYPSLIGLQKRMDRTEVLERIALGGNKMPGYAPILKGKEDQIIAYLFDIEENDEVILKEASSSDTTEGYFNITAYTHFRDGSGSPAIKPPWGTLNAIDLHTGEYVWKIPLGNHPELQQPGEENTGSENYGGPIVTAGGLVFIGATRDKKFRAFDKASGVLLWEQDLPGGGYASPATYQINGRQFIGISVSASENNPSGQIRVYALPDDE